mmetsp:Transcript_56335/g.163405  ORF Transcript_56335/g.163405 Transcript_56335/m.163405 type:complete len:265 (-) Transcript_56335:106-900(-)
MSPLQMERKTSARSSAGLCERSRESCTSTPHLYRSGGGETMTKEQATPCAFSVGRLMHINQASTPRCAASRPGRLMRKIGEPVSQPGGAKHPCCTWHSGGAVGGTPNFGPRRARESSELPLPKTWAPGLAVGMATSRATSEGTSTAWWAAKWLSRRSRCDADSSLRVELSSVASAFTSSSSSSGDAARDPMPLEQGPAACQAPAVATSSPLPRPSPWRRRPFNARGWSRCPQGRGLQLPGFGTTSSPLQVRLSRGRQEQRLPKG